MRIPNKTKARLSLSRETLRTLTDGELAQVAGGEASVAVACGPNSRPENCRTPEFDPGGSPSLPSLCPTSNFTGRVLPVHQPGSP